MEKIGTKKGVKMIYNYLYDIMDSISSNLACFVSIVFTLSFGKIFNVLSYRIPAKLDIDFSEDESLKYKSYYKHWYQYIPIIGEFLNNKNNIKVSNIFIELFTTLISVVVVKLMWPNPSLIFYLIAIYFSILLFLTDIKTYYLPDSITYLLLWTGLLGSALQITTITPEMSILGAFFGYASLYTLAYLFKIIKKTDAMAFGDFKYIAAVGAWTGPLSLCFIVFLFSIVSCFMYIIVHIVRKIDSSKIENFQKESNKCKEIMEISDEYKDRIILPIGPSISISFITIIFMKYIIGISTISIGFLKFYV